MHQAVNSLVNANEQSEIRNVFDFTFNGGSHRVFFIDDIPRIRHNLFHAQGNPAIFRFDVQYDGVDLFTNGNQFGRMPHFACPGHFGNVDEPFDTFFQFDEGAVIGETDNLAGDPRTYRVMFGSGQPGIFGKLFHAQGNAFFFQVEIQNLDLDLISHGEHLRRMFHPAPADVGNMQQTVHTAQIDKYAIFSDVLDDAVNDTAFLNGSQGGGSFLFPFLFKDNSSGEDDVTSFTVVFQYFEFKGLADHIIKVANRAKVCLGSR